MAASPEELKLKEEKKKIQDEKKKLKDEQKKAQKDAKKRAKELAKKEMEYAKQKANPKKDVGYQNGPLKPYMGSDGHLHCTYCRRRYEPGHRCNKPYK